MLLDKETEARLELAIEALLDGRFSVIKHAAGTYRVSDATLGRRLKERLQRNKRKGSRNGPNPTPRPFFGESFLTKSQEESLVRMIQSMGQEGYIASLENIKNIATQMMRIRGDTKRVADNKWATRFINRHRDLTVTDSNTIDSQRPTDPQNSKSRSDLSGPAKHEEHYRTRSSKTSAAIDFSSSPLF